MNEVDALAGCKGTPTSSALKKQPPQPSPCCTGTGCWCAVTCVCWEQETHTGSEGVMNSGSALCPFRGRAWWLGCSVCPSHGVTCSLSLAGGREAASALFFTFILSLPSPKEGLTTSQLWWGRWKCGSCVQHISSCSWGKKARGSQRGRGKCIGQQHLVSSALSVNRL